MVADGHLSSACEDTDGHLGSACEDTGGHLGSACEATGEHLVFSSWDADLSSNNLASSFPAISCEKRKMKKVALACERCFTPTVSH